MLRNYDQEKTQAVEPQELRDVRLKQEVWQAQCGANSRQLTPTEILAQLFAYHPPTDEQLPKYAAINQAAKNFAEVILQNCPASTDRSAAIRLIRDARMTANASVALNGLSL